MRRRSLVLLVCAASLAAAVAFAVADLIRAPTQAPVATIDLRAETASQAEREKSRRAERRKADDRRQRRLRDARNRPDANVVAAGPRAEAPVSAPARGAGDQADQPGGFAPPPEDDDDDDDDPFDDDPDDTNDGVVEPDDDDLPGADD